MLQSCQLSCILRETHAFPHNLTLTHIITSISRAKHLHAPLYGTESGRGNQHHVQLQTEIPQWTIVQKGLALNKTEDRRQGKPEKVEWCSYYIGRIAARAKYGWH